MYIYIVSKNHTRSIPHLSGCFRSSYEKKNKLVVDNTSRNLPCREVIPDQPPKRLPSLILHPGKDFHLGLDFLAGFVFMDSSTGIHEPSKLDPSVYTIFARTRTWFWHLSRSRTEGIESLGWKLWNCRSWCHDPNVGTRSFHHFCVRITAVAEGIQRIFERISGCHRCRRHGNSTRTHLPRGWNSCENLRK